MYFNIMVDFGIGLVPFLGDMADALFRANTRNAVVLEKHLRDKGAKALKAQGVSTPVTDPTDPDEFDRQLREEHGPPPPYSGDGQEHTQSTQRQEPGSSQAQSTQAQVPETRGGGWFGGFGSKKKQPDLEAGGLNMREQAPPMPPRKEQQAPLMPPRPSNGST
jgi:hypothetical protein